MIHMRQFTASEQKNIRVLVNMGIEHTLVQITPTGYKKGILDSTAPMREYFHKHGIHDYSQQLQGKEHKFFAQTYIYNVHAQYKTTTSLYRPKTKNGDPRLWIYGIKGHCQPNDIIALISYEEALHAFNLSSIDISRALDSPLITPIQDLLKSAENSANDTAIELLKRLRPLSENWSESEIVADTGIGRTVEHFLGIPMNSLNQPDYKGIELKSYRKNRGNVSQTLFCKVPNWEISHFKRSVDILREFGYLKEGRLTFHNSLYCHNIASQGVGLTLYLDTHLLAIEKLKKIKEEIKKLQDVALWNLDDLHKALINKHKETFWIEAESKVESGHEYFRISKIEHTRNPIPSQFDFLLDNGKIYVDMSLGRSKKHGDIFSFKIQKGASPLLFPERRVYNFKH